jgi:hypothetical protein
MLLSSSSRKAIFTSAPPRRSACRTYEKERREGDAKFHGAGPGQEWTGGTSAMDCVPSSPMLARHIRRDDSNLYGPPFIPGPLPSKLVMSARAPPGPNGPYSSSITNCVNGRFSSSAMFLLMPAWTGNPINLTYFW